jgi:hypothetical protein
MELRARIILRDSSKPSKLKRGCAVKGVISRDTAFSSIHRLRIPADCRPQPVDDARFVQRLFCTSALRVATLSLWP